MQTSRADYTQPVCDGDMIAKEIWSTNSNGSPPDLYDVIVVGGGPAGTVTAYELLRREPGLKVLVLEKAVMPRLKPCAGGIAPQAERLLKETGLWEAVEPVRYPVTAAELVTSSGRRIRLSGGAAASVLHRAELDRILLGKAEEAGSEVRQGVKAERLYFEDGAVVLECSRQGDGVVLGGSRQEDAAAVCRNRGGGATSPAAYRGRLAVIAAGAVTNLRLPDPDKELITSCTAWFEGARFTQNTMRMVFPGELSPHYAWLFPESDTRCSIGFCIRLSRLWRQGAGDENIREERGGSEQGRGYEKSSGKGVTGRSINGLYQEILDLYFRENIAGAVRIIPPKVFPIYPSKRFGYGAYPGTLLVGDAARTINAFTGEGISFVLEGASAAAESIIEGFHSGREWKQIERVYLKRLRAAVGGPLRTGRMLCTFGPALMKTAGLFSRLPGLNSIVPRLMTKV